MLVVVVFGAHKFPELLFAGLLAVFLPCAPALDPHEQHPDAEGHGKVWNGVSFVQRAQHGAGGNYTGEDKKEESFHDI